MNNKIVGIFVCILIILICFIPSVGRVVSGLISNNSSFISMHRELLNDDQLDQYNYESDIGYQLYFNRTDDFIWLGQSFRPTLPTLTRVRLWIGKASHNTTSDLIISIRSDINGSDLVMVSKHSYEIPEYPDLDWVEFNFNDLYVVPGDTYFIVATCNYTGHWYFGYGLISVTWDAYADGDLWSKNDYHEGGGWYKPGGDACFETYGTASVLEIENINGGFRAGAVLKNKGLTSIYDISWSIDLSGGFIIAGGHDDGVIDKLVAGETTTIRQSTLYGIGRTTITVTVGDATKQATGFILGPLVLGVEEI